MRIFAWCSAIRPVRSTSTSTASECADLPFLVGLAERAEAAGWDGIFVEDYVCYGGDAAAPTCNSCVALAAMAVRIERVRLGIGVTPDAG